MRGARAKEPLGVLLMAYGSPSGPEDLKGYLTEVMHGATPDAALVQEYIRRYELIGWSPQNRITASVRKKLELRLQRERPGARVYLATKHWAPNIATVIPEAARDGFRHLVAVPLSPYASIWIMEPYRVGVAEGIRAASTPIEVDVRGGWHLDPNWIGYWVRAIRAELERIADRQRCVLLSAHSLPQRFRDRGDPYPELVRATAGEIARSADLDRWSFTYQSPGNTTEPWLGPLIEEVMTGWKERGARTQLIASVGFAFDHLEVLYDLDVVVREYAESLGIEYRRVPMPNDANEVVDALASTALRQPVP